MSARDELFQLMIGRTTLKAVERIIGAGYVKVSEAAIERAAKAAYVAQMEDGDTPWENFGGSSYLDYWRDQARAVVAALREGA
jgi:hypothetical protein